MTKWLLGMALVLVAGVAVAGCGSSDSKQLSKADFITQADAICTTAHAEENKIDFPTVNPDTATDDQLDELADAMEAAIKVDRAEIDDLQELTPPDDFTEGYDESMKELGESLDAADEAVDEARNHDKEGVTRALAKAQAKSTEANERAKAYGLKVCGSASS